MQKTLLFLILALFANSLVVSGQSRYEVERATFSSDRYDEFSPVLFDGLVVFCSNQRDKTLIAYQNQRKKSLFNIYKVTLTEDNQYLRPEIFSRNLVTPFHDGPVAFYPDGNNLVYSRNIDTRVRARNVIDTSNNLGLFFAEMDAGDWINKSAFQYNGSEYSNMTPFFSPDGQYLYYSSNMPGGFGGVDLYRSRLLNAAWGEPENLGDRINTPGNESYPFISTNGYLFFASDGRGGLGKKDIFYSLETESGWSDPAHLEAPINSPEDDFGIFTNEELTEGYFASDRGSGDDIYKFSTPVPKLFYCEKLLKNQYCFEFWDEQAPEIDSLQVTYEWEFSDSTKIKGLRVEHCLPGAGKHWAKLNIIDKSTEETFLTQTKIDFEIVDHVQPFITCSDTLVANRETSFSGLDSNLPGVSIQEYIWDFGDGGFTTGPEVDYMYAEPGIYNVKLGLKIDRGEGSAKEIRCVTKQVVVIADEVLGH